MRIGIGHALYAFDPKRVLVLGGVKIPGAWGLRGPGDADVVCLAVIDALLGAAASGDRADALSAAPGETPSAVLVAGALETLAAAGLAPAHVDVSLIAERPPLREHRAPIRDRLASLLRLEPAQVSVKASAGGPGALGPGAEGIAALAVASLKETA